MLQNPFPGKFIVFEGLDGSGTTTQASLLFEYFKKQGRKAYLTSEPTGSMIGGVIKSRLSGAWESSPECLQLLFSADRAYHLEKEIVPLLQKGIDVICTRYILSALAYGSLEIKDEKWLEEINKKFIVPDTTFFLKTKPETCIKRIRRERMHKELFEKKDDLIKVYKNYLKLLKNFPKIFLIDGEKTINEISYEIISKRP